MSSITIEPAANLRVGPPDLLTHLLDSRSPELWDAAVTLLSRLLAADAHVLLPAVDARSAGSPARAAALLRMHSELQHLLFLFHHHLTGDGRVVRQPIKAVRESVADTATRYLTRRDELLSAVADSKHDLALAARWVAALDAAPTRPHPHLARSRALRNPAFRLAARWDRVRDTLDSRPTTASF